MCYEHGFYPGNWFSLKLKLIREPGLTTTVLCLISVFVFANIIIVFELEQFMPNSPEALESPYFTAVYFSIVTMSTIGYGDYCPSTLEGRFITMLAAVWGAILIALFVTVVTELF